MRFCFILAALSTATAVAGATTHRLLPRQIPCMLPETTFNIETIIQPVSLHSLCYQLSRGQQRQLLRLLVDR
jgi:hypothetical protein